MEILVLLAVMAISLGISRLVAWKYNLPWKFPGAELPEPKETLPPSIEKLGPDTYLINGRAVRFEWVYWPAVVRVVAIMCIILGLAFLFGPAENRPPGWTIAAARAVGAGATTFGIILLAWRIWAWHRREFGGDPGGQERK